MVLLGLSIAPGLAICLYIFLKAIYNKEPKRMLLFSFFGTFDFFIFLQANEAIKAYVSDGLLFTGAVISYIIAIILSRKHLRLHRQLSKQSFKPDQHV